MNMMNREIWELEQHQHQVHGVIQMMLPALSSETSLYHYIYIQNLLSSEYINSSIMSRLTAKSQVSYLQSLIIYSDDSILHNGTQMTQMTAQVALLE